MLSVRWGFTLILFLMSIYCVLCCYVGVLHVSPVLTPACHSSNQSFLLKPRFPDQENEAQRGPVTCLKVWLLLLFSCWVLSNSFVTPWIVAHQSPLPMEFLKQEYWRGLPFPSPGDFPDPGIEPVSPALAGRFFTTEPPGKPCRLPCR